MSPRGGGVRDPLDRRDQVPGASKLESAGPGGPGRRSSGPGHRSGSSLGPDDSSGGAGGPGPGAGPHAGGDADAPGGRSYYGSPILQPPVWAVMDIAGYLYLGGLAGSASMVGAFGDLTGRPALRRASRLTAGGAAVVSVVALVHDLGVPLRFVNMLRVFKWTSPMNVGSWILAPFGTLAGIAMATELPALVLPVVSRVAGRRVARTVEHLLPGVGSAAGVGSALLGPALTTYTAVLLADTAVPAWHEAYPELPFVFAASGMASAGGAGMVGAPVAEAGPARRLGAVGAGAELALMARMERRVGMVGEVYSQGRSGTLLTLSRVALGLGGVGALVAPRLGRWARAASVTSGLLLNAGAALTRFGIYEGGVASAKDPKYTVVPQRERLEARKAARAAADGGDGASAAPPAA